MSYQLRCDICDCKEDINYLFEKKWAFFRKKEFLDKDGFPQYDNLNFCNNCFTKLKEFVKNASLPTL